MSSGPGPAPAPASTDGARAVFESPHFRFLVPADRDDAGERRSLAQDAAHASERLELFYAELEAEGLVPADDLIDVLLVAIAHGSEPPAEDRGIDIIDGAEVGVRGYYDPRLRAEWLERDVVKVFLGEVLGPEAAACPFVVDGLLGALASRVSPSARLGEDALRRKLEAGARLDVAELVANGRALPPGDFHRAAASFIGFARERLPTGGLRAFLRELGARAAYGPRSPELERELGRLEQLWLDKLRRRRVGAGGSAAFLLKFVSFGREEWRSMAGVLAGIAIGVGFEAAIPMTTRFILDEAVAPRDARLLWIVLAALAALFVVQALVGVVREYVAARTGARVADKLRVRLFSRLQELTSSYYARVELGDVVSRMTVDASFVEQGFTEVAPTTVTLALGLLVNLVLLFALAPRLAAITLLAAPITAMGMRWAIPRNARALQERQALRADVGAYTAENFQAQSVVRAFGLSGVVAEQFGAIVDKLGASNRKVVFLTSLVGLSAALPVALVQLVALGAGAWLVMQGGMSVGSLVAFLSLLAGVLAPMKAIAWAIPALQRASVSLDRLEEILAEKPEVADAPGAPPMPPLSRDIALDDVTFGYAGDQTTIDRLSLTIPAGKSVVFVGPSGCGKSTVLNLVMRFYDPQWGALRVDGADLRAFALDSVRSRISVVFQDTFLFNVSVRDNIRLGKLGATDDEVIAAAKLADVHDAVMALPQGYDTRVGERGGRLSGGQRQRIAIARALVRDPSIIVLDEATSALDARTEAAINETLKRACRGRTVLTVTHRLAWAEDADLIFALDKGRLVERGTHAELLAREGAYRRLWEQQRGFVVNESGRIVGIEPARLASIELFRGLGREHLDKLAREFVIDRREPGAVVFEEGDLADKFYVVGRGQVAVDAIGPSGARRRLATLRDGDPFGEIGLLTNRRRTATVTVTAPTELLVLEGARFLELIEAHADLRDALNKRIAAMAAPPAQTLRTPAEM